MFQCLQQHRGIKGCALIGNLFRFLMLCMLKFSRYWCYPTTLKWIGNEADKDWRKVRLILILNHTSLVEFVYATTMPTPFLWQMAKRLVFPVADISLDKAQGKMFKLFAPRIARLSRKRDDTWNDFVQDLGTDSILIFMPEGRMKRPNGLDKNGQPMTVRSGIVDILPLFSGSELIIAYSGGLHHVMAPGQIIPRPFRKLTVNLEVLDVDEYLAGFDDMSDDTQRRKAICRDLEERRDRHCPKA